MPPEMSLDPDTPDVLRPDEDGLPFGFTTEYVLVDGEFARIDGVLRRRQGEKSDVVVIQTHPRRSSAMNLNAWPMSHLVGRGVDTFSYNNRATNSAAGTEVITIWEDLALDVAAAVAEMRRRGYQYVVLYGHSAGGPLVTYYQSIAEHGNSILSKKALSQFAGYERNEREVRLPAADAVVTQSSTAGTAYSFLMRLDGSVIDEERGTRDPDLDPFSSANGFDPETGAGHYSEMFIRSYRAAQCRRMNRLIDQVRRKRMACSEGRGLFLDDDLIVIHGIRGELACVDLSLSAATTRPYTVSSSGAPEIVTSRRRIVPGYARRNSSFRDGGTVHTLRSFLSYRAVVAAPEFWDPEAVTADASGIDLSSTHSSTSANISAVTVPVLMTYATADTQVHLPTAELIFNAAAQASHRNLVFIDGAEHDMTATEERFGDTRAQHLSAVVDWLAGIFPRLERGA